MHGESFTSARLEIGADQGTRATPRRIKLSALDVGFNFLA